jgi:dimethylhistidine N-methyltransferase
VQGLGRRYLYESVGDTFVQLFSLAASGLIELRRETRMDVTIADLVDSSTAGCIGTTGKGFAADWPARAELMREVQEGLQLRPRSLKPWMLYDELGSRLFERITTLPEYYPTRTERSLLESHAEAIVAAACADSQPLRVIELGAGTASKTCLLLEAALRKQIEVIYMPLDVSADALEIACQEIEDAFPRVLVEPVVVNYVTNPPILEEFDGSTLALYLGSSIGNFVPQESRTILRNIGSQLRSGDALVLGTDLVKEKSTLIAAYDDSEGVTAAFNLNILNRLNNELGADFDPAGFRHCVRWNTMKSRIEMHLESIREQTVQIPTAELEIRFADGETIHTENSYKFTDSTLAALLSDSGFEIESTWKDRRDWYALTLSRRHDRNEGDYDWHSRELM